MSIATVDHVHVYSQQHCTSFGYYMKVKNTPMLLQNYYFCKTVTYILVHNVGAFGVKVLVDGTSKGIRKCNGRCYPFSALALPT